MLERSTKNINEIQLNSPVNSGDGLWLEGVTLYVSRNATGQIFVENPTYFPPDYINSPELKERLKDVPAGRLSPGGEAATLLLFLASSDSDFLVGQIFPYAGGWVV